jgi:drug/metabolite transporter (DMT)-like permease
VSRSALTPGGYIEVGPGVAGSPFAITGGVTAAAVALESARGQRRGQLYVALAAVAWSSAGVLQRQLTLDTPTQVFGRSVFAGLALLAYVAVMERGRVVQAFRSIGVAGLAVALCVAAASGGFIGALNHTSVARVLFILAVAPVLAALLARVTLGEPISRRTVIAMAVALAGVALMLGAPGEGSLAGDGLALLTALAFALMIVITRWRQDVSMAPATCLSQAILVAIFLPFASIGEIGSDNVGWLAALGIGQIGLGFALLTVGARLIPAAQVGLITLLEVVLGPVWVWLALDERPSTLTLVGGVIVIAAIVVQTSGSSPRGRGGEGALPAPH